MGFYGIVFKTRSYRAFDESRVITREELEYLVSLARVTPSAVNKQPLKYVLVYEPAEVEAFQPLTKWGRALPDMVLPPRCHQHKLNQLDILNNSWGQMLSAGCSSLQRPL